MNLSALKDRESLQKADDEDKSDSNERPRSISAGIIVNIPVKRRGESWKVKSVRGERDFH